MVQVQKSTTFHFCFHVSYSTCVIQMHFILYNAVIILHCNDIVHALQNPIHSCINSATAVRAITPFKIIQGHRVCYQMCWNAGLANSVK